MGIRRRLHATAWVAASLLIAGGIAASKPAPKPGKPPAPAPGSGSGSGSGSAAGSGSGSAKPGPPPKSAGSSPIESTDVPAWTAPPARFAVAPFENHANAHAFDWLIAGAPFEVAEKTEAVLGLDPSNPPLFVGDKQIETEPDPIAAFAKDQKATYVITGWCERPNWQLRVGMTLWKVTGPTAIVVADAQRTGDGKLYHQLLGETLAELWQKGANLSIDPAKAQRLQRVLATDLYSVNLMGRGLGHLTGALGTVDLKSAEKDLEKAVFIDPKHFEAQRLLGEIYLAQAADPKAPPNLAARALSKFNYANDLAPDDIASLRSAALGAEQGGKHEVALELFRKLVSLKPWDLDARYHLGAALWHTGDPTAAEKQLEQVTAHDPDHLAARRVLVLIHSSRSDTQKLVHELEAIAKRAPDDLEIKADLATAYGALAEWDKAVIALELIAQARPNDAPLAIRIGDAHRKLKDLDTALTWYGRASKLDPQSSWPGFIAAQALFDAGRLAEAQRAFVLLQRYPVDLPAAEQALGAIALIQNRADDAAWYLRKATREAPRWILAWRAVIAAELARKDPTTALRDAGAALMAWPKDAQIHYLTGVAFAMIDSRSDARRELAAAIAAAPDYAPPRIALGALDAGGAVALSFTPELVRPWGDADVLADELAHFKKLSETMAASRATYQNQFLTLLGALGRGPLAPAKHDPIRVCPIARVAPGWAAAQTEFWRLEYLGAELETTYKFLARHDDAGATQALLPNARTQVTADRKAFKLALADMGELRAEWTRNLVPELHAVGCYDRLLAAAAADPAHYHLIEEDQPEQIPTTQPQRPKARATFYVDNTRCLDPVDVWIDGTQLGQVAAGRRSALVADGGERTLCLLPPGAAQCGDRGTVRQVYLHDGWAVTMHCLK